MIPWFGLNWEGECLSTVHEIGSMDWKMFNGFIQSDMSEVFHFLHTMEKQKEYMYSFLV